MKYFLLIYGIGAAATAVMLTWRMIFRTERILGMVRKMVAPALESLQAALGDKGVRVFLAVVMIFAILYQTLTWPWTMWRAVTRKDEDPS